MHYSDIHLIPAAKLIGQDIKCDQLEINSAQYDGVAKLKQEKLKEVWDKPFVLMFYNPCIPFTPASL